MNVNMMRCLKIKLLRAELDVLELQEQVYMTNTAINGKLQEVEAVKEEIYVLKNKKMINKSNKIGVKYGN